MAYMIFLLANQVMTHTFVTINFFIAHTSHIKTNWYLLKQKYEINISSMKRYHTFKTNMLCKILIQKYH